MRNRIAFHRLYDFHDAMLKPIYAELKNEFDCLYSSSVEEVISFAPDILVFADLHIPLSRMLPPHVITVWTRHGLISKNYAAPSILQCDFACVSSEWVRNDFIKKGHAPRCGFWVTGFVPTDVIFNAPPLRGQPSWLNQIDPAKPVLLYAPTYNESLGSVEMLGDEWAKRILDRHADLVIIIKPHPHIPERQPAWMDRLRRTAAHSENIHLIEDCHRNIYELFSSVDILMSDASSAIFYFLLCNKPIILINNSSRHDDREYFDPEGIEWKWRDCGIVIDDVSQLPDALSMCLSRPEEKEEIRMRYRDLLFDKRTFGRASKNSAERVRALLKPPEGLAEWMESVWHMAAQVNELHLKRESGHSFSDVCSIARNAMAGAFRRKLDRYPHLKGTIRKVMRRLI
jgi:teichoic acid glycerol-phosphate transferase